MTTFIEPVISSQQSSEKINIRIWYVSDGKQVNSTITIPRPTTTDRKSYELLLEIDRLCALQVGRHPAEIDMIFVNIPSRQIRTRFEFVQLDELIDFPDFHLEIIWLE